MSLIIRLRLIASWRERMAPLSSGSPSLCLCSSVISFLLIRSCLLIRRFCTTKSAAASTRPATTAVRIRSDVPPPTACRVAASGIEPEPSRNGVRPVTTW